MASFAVPFRPQSNAPPLVYDTPEWAAPPLYDYGFEILKGGVQVDKMSQLRKDKLVIGRLPLCDISLEHPSVSRYHAIVQFNQQGDGFIYDLNSAHGTFLNRTRLPARSHVSIKAGDQLIFGESTRICIFDTSKPISEADMAREEAIADRYRAQRKMAALRLAQKTQVHEQKEEEDQGISWGFREDAEEEEEEEEEEDASGTASGDAALLNVNTEKMAFEDAKRRREELEVMYGDDNDNDTFYDRTVKKKKKSDKAETYDELVERLRIAQEELKEVHAKIRDHEQEASQKPTEEEENDLDAFMKTLEKTEQKQPLAVLKRDEQKLTKVFYCIFTLLKPLLFLSLSLLLCFFLRTLTA